MILHLTLQIRVPVRAFTAYTLPLWSPKKAANSPPLTGPTLTAVRTAPSARDDQYTHPVAAFREYTYPVSPRRRTRAPLQRKGAFADVVERHASV